MGRRDPIYLSCHRGGGLKEKALSARIRMASCDLCPRECRVNRLEGETGVCRTGEHAWLSSYGPHYGEESPLVGTGGSGTVFFTHCNLLCLFCQNYDISRQGRGREVTDDQLASVMMALQEQGCHHINLVTPSHVIPQILSALEIAIPGGLRLPIVYNTSAYDRVDTLKLLEGVVDIYMPDFKFWSPRVAKDACNAPDYPEKARAAIREMHRQAGDLVIDEEGIAVRGLLVRHLVLPRGLSGAPEVMAFIASSLSRDTYVNIMGQYRPCGRAAEIPGFSGYPSKTDMEHAVAAARASGLHRLDVPRRVFMIT